MVLEKLQLQLNISDLKIENNHHSFTRGRSTVSALFSTTQKWFNITDISTSGRKVIHAVFLDFRKAFDLVDDGILLQKLPSINVTKSFWLWTQSFLKEKNSSSPSTRNTIIERALPIWCSTRICHFTHFV